MKKNSIEFESEKIVCDCFPFFSYKDHVATIRGYQFHHPLCSRERWRKAEYAKTV